MCHMPSVLWRCLLGSRKGIRRVKNWVVRCWRGCLGWGADLHIAQQMPLPLTISCSSKSRLVLTFLVLPFWYLLTRVVPDIFQESSKAVVCEMCYLPVSGPSPLLRICCSFFSSFSWRRFRITSSGLEMLRVKLDSGSSLYSCCATPLSFSLPLDDANISFCFFFNSFFSRFDNFRRKLPACDDALCPPWLVTLSVDSVGGYDGAEQVKSCH